MTDTSSFSAQEYERPDRACIPVDWVDAFFARRDPDAERKAAETLVQSVDQMVRVANAITQTGRPVNLNGLENCVGRLTASVLDLDPPQGRLLRPALEVLVRNLNKLEHSTRSRAPPVAAC